MFRASFGIVLSIGAVLFAIWPNILPLQQHLAMAQVVPGSAPPIHPSNQTVPGNTTASNTTASNTTASNTTASNTTAGVRGGALPNH
jgi:hypothetical protein